MKETVFNLISTDELVGMASDLVRCPSYDGVPNQETETARRIKALFDAEDIPCELDEVRDGRCNVYATLKGTGGGRKLMLSGHMDTVSPANQPHGLEPYLDGGRLIGRGTSDMKGALACMIGAMRAIKRSGIKLAGDIVFAGCIDEELRSYGTVDAVEKGYQADGVIVGEPTELQVHIAQRGLEWYEFNFIGKTVHGGRQRDGINAILMANRFLDEIVSYLTPKVFARKHPLLTEATLNVGVIHGGTGLSTVPGQCRLLIDRRFLPYEDYVEVGMEFQRILDKLSAGDPQFKCEMKVMDESVMKEGYVHQPFETPADQPIVQCAWKAAQEVSGFEPMPIAHKAWTDAALFSRYGNTPAVIMGPGSSLVCHSEFEYVPIDQLEKACKQYALTALEFCK
jgi:acetylornithine deacetylase or succinyl-diaminopimelate desuccinylase